MDFPSLQESSERRRATRHATRFGAYFLIGADSFAVSIQDYSATGLLLTFDRDMPAPERLAGWVKIDPTKKPKQIPPRTRPQTPPT